MNLYEYLHFKCYTPTKYYTHLFQSIKSEDSFRWNIIQVIFVTYKEKGIHLQGTFFPNNEM